MIFVGVSSTDAPLMESSMKRGEPHQRVSMRLVHLYGPMIGPPKEVAPHECPLI